MNKKTIGIIPARSGSKRIPKKNILDFFDKPLIAWTIEAAIKSQVFDRVLVSTDSSEIADISIGSGAEVPFLRSDAFDDHSPVSVATLSALAQAEEYWNESYTEVVQLMPNCPIRDSEDIVEAFNSFRTRNRKFQLSAFEFGWMNPWWAATLSDDGAPQFLHAESLSMRSQDLPNLYCPTGAIWIANVALFKKQCTFYGEGFVFHPISWTSALDIDDLRDLEMALAVKKMLDAGAQLPPLRE